MDKHIDNLKEHVGRIEGMRVLDLGSGRGKFLVELAKRGGNGKGVELSLGYIEETKRRAAEAGVSVEVRQGVGEKIPFPDKSFDFVNMSEVIEHVEHPEKVMSEVARVLGDGGKVYVSVPSRFSVRDTHFHLYFVNWLPRAWSDAFISLFGKHKDYHGDTGHQRLKDLHYYTDRGARKLFASVGFDVADIRRRKIAIRFKNPVVRALVRGAYAALAPVAFDTYHYLLTKRHAK